MGNRRKIKKIIYPFFFLLLSGITACQADNKSQSAFQSKPLSNAEKTDASARQNWVPMEMPAMPGIELGYAYDMTSGEFMPNRCIEFAPVENTAQTSSVSMHKITDKTDIIKNLNMSGSASLKSVLGSGSAQASLLRESNVSTTSSTLMLHAQVTNGSLSVGPSTYGYYARPAYPELKDQKNLIQKSTTPATRLSSTVTLSDWAQKLWNEDETVTKDNFRKYCGDGFISKIESGADVVAMFSFTSKDAAEHTAMSASLEAKYLGGSLSTKAKAEIDQVTANTNLSIEYTQLGGGGGLLPTTEEGLQSKLSTLTLEAASSPRFHTMTVSPYPDLPPNDPSPTYAEIADWYWVLNYVINEMNKILSDETRSYPKLDEKNKPVYCGNYYWYEKPGTYNSSGMLDNLQKVRKVIFSALNNTFKPTTTAAREALFQNPPVKTDPSFNAIRIFRDYPSDPKPPPVEPEVNKELLDWLQQFLPDGFTSPHILKILLAAPRNACPVQYTPVTGVSFSPDFNKIDCVSPVSAPHDVYSVSQLIMQWYLAPQVNRACQADPASSLCLNYSDFGKLTLFLMQHYPSNYPTYTGKIACTTIGELP